MSQSLLDLSKYTSGLIYDADTVTLIGKYTDELSCHRARKNWVELFSNYFLLEANRDYDILVESDLDGGIFIINCIFTSACGRYAFWRLVNQQAPEAEQKLGETVILNDCSLDTKKDECTVWVTGALDEQIRQTRDTQNLLDRIIKLFK